MNINDLKPSDYKVISNPTNINQLAPGSYKSVSNIIDSHNALKVPVPEKTSTFQSSPTDSPLIAGAKSVGNLPSSVFNLGKNIVSTVLHPIDTTKSLLDIASGAGAKVAQTFLEHTQLGHSVLQKANDVRKQQGLPELDTDSEGNIKVPETGDLTKINQLGEAVKNRYGSIEAAQKTATEDPAGFGADVLSILEGGAGLAGKTEELDNLVSKVGGTVADATKIPQALSKVSETAGNVKDAIKAPFTASPNTEMQQAFDSEGIKAPVSAVTKSPAIQQLEAAASKTAFGQKVKDIATEAQSQLESKVNDLVSKVKPEKTMSDEGIGNMLQQGADEFHKNLASNVDAIKPVQTSSAENLGKTLQEGLQEYEENFKLNQGKIYDEFSKTYGKSNVYGQSTKDALGTLIKEQSLDQFKGIDPRLTKMLNKVTGVEDPELKDLQNQINEFKSRKGGTVPPELQKAYDLKAKELDKNLTFNELKSTRSAVGEALSGKDSNNPALKRLYGALSNDMTKAVSDAASHPDDFGAVDAQAAKDALDRLNEGFSSGKNKIESNIAQSISQSSPENIAQNLIKRNSAGTLAQTKEMIGPERFAEVQKSFMRELLNGAQKDGVYNPEKIKSSLGEYDKETLDQLLSPDQQKNINNVISKLSENSIKSDIASSIKNDSPEKIAQNISKKNSAEYLKNVKDVVGEDRFKEVSKQFLQQQFEKSFTREKFDIDKFKKNINSVDSETLKQILPEDQHQALNEAITKWDKYKSMNEALKVGKKYTEGSQTAFLLQKISQKDRIFTALGAAATGHPGIAAAVAMDFGGELLFSKLFTSDLGRKLLTEGITVPNLKRLEALKLTSAQISGIKKALIPLRYTSNSE